MINASERIFFSEEKNGYDRAQVDKYVNKLSEAYQAAYDENTLMRERYNSLLDSCNTWNMPGQSEPTPEIITKTLVYTEMLAQKIITDAHEEAARAKAEAQKIITDANTEAVDRAKRNLEQAYEIMEEAISKVESLLNFNASHEKIA
jgi:cell division septum initiation protein DivIVA